MNDRLKDQALRMMKIMIERIKQADEAGEPNGVIRTSRAAGANFILYHLGILTLEEFDEFDRRIFHTFDDEK